MKGLDTSRPHVGSCGDRRCERRHPRLV